MSAPTRTILETRDLRVGYAGGVDILRDLDLSVQRGEITGVIGANGAGKSTLMKTLFGLLDPRFGSVWFDGEDVSSRSTSERKALGIAYLPQHHSTFGQMTVEENLLVGGWLIRKDPHFLKVRVEYVLELFPMLADLKQSLATDLSGGQLRMLAVAKEVVTPAKLLLVDEPSVGMAPNIAMKVYEFLAAVADDGVTILLVDQNVAAAVDWASTVYLIDSGQVARHGEGSWFRENLSRVVSEMLSGGAGEDDK